MKVHLGDDEASIEILSMLWKGRFGSCIPYKPFEKWPEVEDDVFKDLVMRLMNLDPAKRMTAQQAMEHPWFKDVL